MNRKKLKTYNDDGYQLEAYLDFPVNQRPHNYAVFAHCFTCTKNLKAVRNIIRAMTSEGLAVLSLDFTGLGGSSGDFSETNFSSNISDLEAACNFLSEHYEAPTLLVGHSLGGTAALKTAAKLDNVKAAATIGSPAEPDHIKHVFEDQLDTIRQEGAAKVNIGGRPFKIKEQFVEDIRNHKIEDDLQAMKKPLAFLHSPQDKIVSIDNASKLFTRAHHPKSFISLDGADHLLSNQKDSLYTGEVIGSWAKRYLDIPEEPELETDAQTIARLGSPEDKFTTQIKMGKHQLIADEPPSVGGNDFGPSPYELLNAALGACTVMTIRMYANHKNLDIREIKTHLNHEKKHVKDSENPESSGSKVDQITRELEIDGDIDEKQRQRLVDIADKCPVHKTLSHGPVEVKTRLKGEY